MLPDDVTPLPIENEADGGFYQIQSQGNQFTYFCNNGVYKSCHILPEGFGDPNGQRFQAIGGIGLFRNDETGLAMCAPAEIAVKIPIRLCFSFPIGAN
jgi:hypothetical protein